MRLKKWNENAKKVVAGTLAVLMCGSLIGTVVLADDSSSTSDEKLTKEETVYVKADASGKTSEITVSDWLKNADKADTLTDASDLSDIENVKGEETYSENSDGTITWKADGNDIYYQGTSKSDLPIGMKVTYTLDGKTVTPDELAGKSGKVTIRYDYTNQEKRTVDVNGKKTEVYVPFTVIMGTMLSTDHFTNVEVTNGKCISEGNNEIVIGYALPGLQESLNISDELLSSVDDEITIPDYVEITADVTDFEMSLSITAASCGLLSESDMLNSFDVSTLTDSAETLADSSKQLVSGTKELADGTSTLQSSFGTFKDGTDTLNSSMKTAASGAASLSSGASQVNSGAASLAANLGSLNSGLISANNGVSKLLAGYTGDGTEEKPGAVNGSKSAASGASTLQSSIDALVSGINNLYAGIVAGMAQYQEAAGQSSAAQAMYASAITQLSTDIAQGADAQTLAADVNAVNTASQSMAQTAGAKGAYEALGSVKASIDAEDLTGEEGKLAKLQKGAADLSEGTASVADGVEELYEGTQSLADGLSTAGAGSEALASGANSLYSGTQSLASGAASLASGSSKLSAGTQSLADGAVQLAEGISTLKDGADTLASGMAQFDEEGIQKIVDLFGGDIEDIADRLEAVQDAAKTYTTFTKLSDNETGTVRFIIETEEISKD